MRPAQFLQFYLWTLRGMPIIDVSYERPEKLPFFQTQSTLWYMHDSNVKNVYLGIQRRVPFIIPVLKIGVMSSNKVVNNEMSSRISQSLTPCLSHNMQRRAFIIFIKTIFLRFLLGDPVSTPHSLWIEFRWGDKRNSYCPYLSRFFYQTHI